MNTNYINIENNKINIKIWLVNFIDEDGIHFIHAPNLDLTGYGYNENEARESFEIVLEEFFDYTLKNKTLDKVLKKHGWKKEISQNVRKSTDILSSIKNNSFINEIFEKYQVNSYHENIAVPNHGLA